MNFGGTAVKLSNIKPYNISNKANDVFKKKFYSDYEEVDYSNYEEINYDNNIDIQGQIEKHANDKEWWENVLDFAVSVKDCYVTFKASVVCGALELVENVGDGLIMLGSYRIQAYTSAIDLVLGTDLTKKVKSVTSDIVSYDWTEKLYSETVKALGVDEEIANGVIHKAGSFIGTTTAYIAVSCVPGGAVVAGATGAVSAMGSSSEQALNCGASLDEAFCVGAVAGISGAVSGGVLNKIGGLAGGAKTIGQVAKYSAMGAGVAMTEPIINTTSQYLVYGKDMVDENGNKIYNGVDGYLDYYKDSGGVLQTTIAGIVGGGSTALKGIKGYRTYNKTVNEFRRNRISEELKNIGVSNSESEKISKALADHYKKARNNSNGKYNSTFVSYRDHGELHVIEVAEYSKNMALRNVVLDENAARQVYFAGLLHDTGMEDAMSVLSKIDEKLDVNLADKSINGVQVRKNHSLNSALIILSDSSLLPKDIDRDIIAMLSLSHSKSTSGINSFNTKQQWLDSIDLLEKASNQNGLNFDANKMRNMVNNDSTFAILKEQATCLRAGDSFSKVVVDLNGNQIMQTSDSVIVKNNNPRTDFNDKVIEAIGDKKALEIEMQDISDITTSGIEITDTFGKAYHIGESNVSFSDNYTGQNFFDVDVTFTDANNVPNASKMVIDERIGELKTFDHIERRSVNIHLPESAEDSALGKFYIKEFTGAGGSDVKVNIIFDK